MRFSTDDLQCFHYSDDMGYLIFCCHSVATKQQHGSELFNRESHHTLCDSIMGLLEIILEFADKLSIIANPIVHQSNRLKILYMRHKLFLISFTLGLLPIISGCGTMFVKIVPCKSDSLRSA